MTNKRALIVSIEKYADSRHNLPGLANDVAAIMAVLTKFGVTDVEVLRDSNATSEGIRNGLNALVDGASENDVRVFYYTGHGTWVPKGFSGGEDEPDGRDQAFVPYEATTASLILDNWMGQFLKTKLHPGSIFYGIYDCCNSGHLYKSFLLNSTKNFEIDAPLVKAVDFSSLNFTGLPVMFNTPESGNSLSIKRIILDENQTNAIHVGAAEAEKPAEVKPINGVRRSVFTWALEQIASPGINLTDFAEALTKKQAEVTTGHTPQITYSTNNRYRKFLE
ncbi:caspase family protein [Pseudomonas sp. JQ36]